MGKLKSHTPKLKKKFYPFVSVCTPTFNRRPFIPMMLECFKNQTYPKDRMEWIIVDDGTDKVDDLINASGIKQIRYFSCDEKMSLGKKRNYMHSFVKGTIIVYMDDDDYYPPERVSHAVDKLTENRHAMCAGSSEIYIYFKHIQQLYQAGPYGPNHATAGTFAFRTELLKESRYEDHAALAEEKHFLKNYTVPFVQLDPMKSILVFSHNHNTFDKKKLLENAHPDFLKPSPKTVDDFIREPKEAMIKEFFMEKIDDLLAVYEPGEPKMKPDVLKQTREIEIERAKMAMQQQANAPIMISRDGEPPKALTTPEILEIMNSQKTDIQNLLQKNQELQQIAINLQQQLIQGQPYQEIQRLMIRIKELEDKINVLEKEKETDATTETIQIEISEIATPDRSKTDPEIN
jgi:glycosyltransferase involved in cell wall biosynthesis